MDTINYGIDLGTTNSAIARAAGDELRVFKNRDQKDVTPSVIYIAKTGRTLVGQKAHNQLLEDPENAAAEFKRLMGQSDLRTFPASNRSLSAEDLSAEVLKALLDDARRQTGDEIRSAVITVPAAFGQLQCEATARSARQVGLESAPLLQEPLAASIAYGLKPGARDRKWLVYDLGGGTFDIAIVSTRDGHLSVLEHRGDNMLGGKDIDRAIVRTVLWPRLCELYALEGTPPTRGRLAQVLHRRAEEAKIDLTFAEATILTISGAGEDADGVEIETEIELTRAELASLSEPIVERTLQLCRDALEQARLGASDLSEILLVGGPTAMHGVRDALESEFGLPLNYSIDPMTVVAFGAAVYASTLPASGPVVTPTTSPGAARLVLAYEPVSNEESCLVAGSVEGPEASRVDEAQVSAASGVWSSGWVPVSDRYFETHVQLLEGKANNFNVELRDRQGRPVPAEPSTFSIRHGLTISDIPLPHSIGAEVVEPDGRRHVDVIFARSTPLPATQMLTYAADKTLRPSEPDDYIGIKIWEGENHEDPESNVWVGALKISAREIKRPVPEGAEIQLAISINESRLLQVEAFVPILNQHFSEGVYIPQENEQRTVERSSSLQADLDTYYERLDRIEEAAEEAGEADLQERVSSLRRKVEDLDVDRFRSVEADDPDPDETRRVVERARELRGAISSIEVKVSSLTRHASAIEGAQKASIEAARVTDKWGETADRVEYEYLAAELKKQIERDSLRGIDKVHEDLNEVRFRVLFRQNWFWQQIFDDVSASNDFIDDERAEKLIGDAYEALEREDWPAFKSITSDLWRLQRRDEETEEKERTLEAGIRRKLR